jgi:integrase
MSEVTTEVLEPQELEALLAQANTRTPTGARNYALLQLMAQTGVRCGEALQVRAADIRQEEWPTNGDRVKVWALRLPAKATKGGRPRQGIPLTPATRQALALWQEKRQALGLRGGPLFCTVSEGKRRAGFAQGEGELVPGKPLGDRYVRDLVKRLAARAGIARRVHPHMLRHTALTALYDKTRDLRMVQTVAGHTTTRMTERYTHVHPLAIAEAMGAVEQDGAQAQAAEGASEALLVKALVTLPRERLVAALTEALKGQ